MCSLLHSAEKLDRRLDQQLSHFALRIDDAAQKLQRFHKRLRQQIEEKERLETKEKPRNVAAEDVAAAAASAEKPSHSDNATRSEYSDATAFVPATTHLHHATAPPESSVNVLLLPGAVTTTDDHEDNDEVDARDHA